MLCSTCSRSQRERLPSSRALPEESFSAAEGQQVYRFKAALRYQPGLWRTIEIQGRQTLAEFDLHKMCELCRKSIDSGEKFGYNAKAV